VRDAHGDEVRGLNDMHEIQRAPLREGAGREAGREAREGVGVLRDYSTVAVISNSGVRVGLVVF
jgi:hypothetical protein